MQGSLLDSLASRLCQSDMKKDVLLMFEVGLGGPEIAAAAGPAENPRVFLGLCCLVSGRYGRHPPHQDFLMYHPPDDHQDMVGIALQPIRRPLVQIDMSLPRLFHTFVQGNAGELDIITEAALAVRLLESQLPEKPHHIRVRRARHQPHMGHWNGTGIDIGALRTNGFYSEALWLLSNSMLKLKTTVQC